MKKRSKLLIIAVAFALALTMIPMSGLAAYADDSSTEVSSVDLTVEKLLCGTKIGNGEIPQPQVPELSSRFSAQAIDRVPASDEQLPAITVSGDALYFVASSGWLVPDPEGDQGYSMMEKPTIAKGGEKYYFYAFVVAGKLVETSDGTTWEHAVFADDATVNVTGGKVVWKEFFGQEVRPDAPAVDEPAVDEQMKVVEEAADEELAAEEGVAFEDVAEEEAEDVVNEPEKAHTKNYYGVEMVIEVTAEHVPGETVVENRVEPTATTDGHYDEVIYCEKCKEELSRVTIPIPHTEQGDNTNNNNNGVPKTADETGLFTWMLILALAAAACIRIKAGSRE
ncbi:MAG: hypothetical protein II113_00990 [Firmicutes bacterium]|nr:hypothetical protein [Bacillota bacterium]